MSRFLRCFLILSTLCLLAGRPTTACAYESDVIAYLPTYYPGPRRLSPALRNGGWSKWLRLYADPAVRRGYRDLLIHLPFGDVPHEHFRITAYLDCLEDPGTQHVASEFVASWRTWREANPEVSIMFYLGPAHADPRLISLLPEHEDRWLSVLKASVAPIIEVKADLCLDAQVYARKGSKADESYDIIREMMQPYGGKLGVEGWPLKANPRYIQSDFIIVAGLPDLTSSELVKPDAESAPVILLDQSSQWPLQTGIEYLSQGYTIAVNPLAGEWRHYTRQRLDAMRRSFIQD